MRRRSFPRRSLQAIRELTRRPAFHLREELDTTGVTLRKELQEVPLRVTVLLKSLSAPIHAERLEARDRTLVDRMAIGPAKILHYPPALAPLPEQVAADCGEAHHIEGNRPSAHAASVTRTGRTIALRPANWSRRWSW